MDPREAERQERRFEEEQRVKERDRAHDAKRELAKQRNDAAIQTGQAAARMVILMNGGAIAGMLAFIGNIATKCKAWTVLTDPLAYFVFGIVAGVLTIGLGWLSNYSSGAEVAYYKELRQPPFLEDTPSSRRFRKVGNASGYASVFFWIAGLIAFGVGSVLIYLAVNKIGPCTG